jgi:GntR family transcriptional regulator
VALLCNYLPADLLPLDTDRLEATGLYRMLRTVGITLHSARQTIGARSATAAEAARLDEQEGAAVLTMQRTAYDDSGRPVEYGSHIYRASRYAFDFRLLVRP